MLPGPLNEFDVRLEIVDSEAFQVPDGYTLARGGKKFMYPSDHGSW